jgi:hypothetical protein
MIKYNPKNFSSLILALVGAACFAQESINSGSLLANDSNQDIIISASIGQIFYQEVTTNDITEIQGVQQPLRFMTLSIDPVTTSATVVTLFPNPATTHFKLDFSQWSDDFSYSIIDINGKLLSSGKILANSAALRVDDLASGIYLITVSDSKYFAKTFKLLKN